MYEYFKTHLNNKAKINLIKESLFEIGDQKEKADKKEELEELEQAILSDQEFKMLVIQYLNMDGLEKLKTYISGKKKMDDLFLNLFLFFKEEDFGESLDKILFVGANSSGKSSALKIFAAANMLQSGVSENEIYDMASSFKTSDGDTTTEMDFIELTNSVLIDFPGLVSPDNMENDRRDYIDTVLKLPFSSYVITAQKEISLGILNDSNATNYIKNNIEKTKNVFDKKATRVTAVYFRKEFNEYDLEIGFKSDLEALDEYIKKYFHDSLSHIFVQPYQISLFTVDTNDINEKKFDASFLLDDFETKQESEENTQKLENLIEAFESNYNYPIALLDTDSFKKNEEYEIDAVECELDADEYLASQF